MDNVVFRTTIPIIILIAAGLLSKRTGVLKQGDERVLSAYVYYFALPALFIVNLAETIFSIEAFRYIIAGIIPILTISFIIITVSIILRLKKDTIFLLIFSTIFGSLAFFGIPFIIFAFPMGEGERLATISAASISVVVVPMLITILELRGLKKSAKIEGVKYVFRRLSKNPLILSVILGTLLSLIGITIPAVISTALHMLGGTSAAVAIFMLGAFLYGRKYGQIVKAMELSLLRMIFLPLLALLILKLFNLSDFEKSVIVLMHSMPLAVSTVILSERYNFFKEVVASLVLITNFGAIIYLNLWLFILGIQ